MAKNETNGKQSINFDESQFMDKNDLLGEEITLTSVAPEKDGSMGGKFRVADIEYDGEKGQIALGSVLSKQWEMWALKMGAKALPCVAVLKKERSKRYYAFESISEK